MSGETNNLDLSQMTDTQGSKHVTNNEGNGQLDAALTHFADVAVTSANAATVSSATLRRAVGLNIINGSPVPTAAITITLPAVSRGIFAVRNATSYTATVQISGQAVTAPTLLSGAHKLFWSDGVNVRSLGSMATQNSNAVAITGGSITGMPSPSNSSDVATKGYTDTAVAAGGLNGLTACALATAAVLPNSPTYSNGTAGVGATLTAGSNAALVVDGTTVTAAQRILVKDQAISFQNGVYTVTTVGSGATPWVLTRATDFDTAAEMLKNSFALVQSGVTLVGSSWLLSAGVTTVGTDPVTFVQFAGGGGSVPLYVPVASDFTTWQNQGTSTAAASNFGMQHSWQTIADPNHRANYWNTSFSGYGTWEVKQVSPLTAVNFQNYGIMLRDSVSGRSVGFKFGYASGEWGWEYSTWNTTTSRNSVSGITSGMPDMPWRRFRIASSTLYMEASFDGSYWYTFHSTALNAWLTNSPNQCGFFCGSIPTVAVVGNILSARAY